MPSQFVVPSVQAIRCDEIVDEGKTAKELWVPCSNKGLSAPDKNLVDDTIKEDDLRTQIIKIVNYVLTFLGLLAVIVIIYSGFLMVTAMGNDDQYEKGKKGVGYVIMGIVLILLSYAIVNWVIRSGGGEVDPDDPVVVDPANPTDPTNPTDSTGDNIQNNYVENYYYELIEDTPVDLSEVMKALEELRNDTSQEISNEINKFITNLGDYINNPMEENWQEFYQYYQDFINNHEDVDYDKLTNLYKKYQNNSTDKNWQELYDLYQKLEKKDITLPDLSDLNKISSKLTSLETTISKLEGNINDVDYDKLIKLYKEYQDNSTEKNWQELYDLYQDLKKDYGDEVKIPDLPDYDQFWDELEDLRQTVKDLKNVMNDYDLDFKKFNFDLKGLEDSLWKLKDEFGDYDLNADELADLYNKYKKEPTEENWQNFHDTYEEFWKNVADMPVIKTVITAKPVSGNAPLNVVLDGLKSSDPSHETIPDGSYEWSYVDASGKNVKLEHKPFVTVEFAEPGSYVVNLRTKSSHVDKDGKKTVLDGFAYKTITVHPSATQFNLEINNDFVETLYKIDLETAQKGLEFDIGKAVPPPWRTFTRFLWDFGDGNSDEMFDTNSFKHAYGERGEFTLSLTLVDDFKEKHIKKFKVVVKDVVANPEISPESGEVATEFNFDASDSRPFSDKIVEYLWKIMNESGKTILESADVSFEHVFSEPWVYQVDLTVVNAYGDSDTQTQELIVQSSKPKALFDWKIAKTSQPNVVTFDASESFDLDAENLTYEWDFDGDGSFEKSWTDQVFVVHTFDKVGQYEVKLKVSDTFGNSSVLEKKVEIKSILGVDFTVNQYASQKWQELLFKAVSSRATTYYWNFDDGDIFQTEELEMKHAFQKIGIFNVELKVFDQDGNSNFIKQKIHIGEADMPIAVMDYLVNNKIVELAENVCDSGKKGLSIYRSSKLNFSAEKSVDASGQQKNLEYIWDFGDGIYSNQENPNHYYNELTQDDCLRAVLKVKDTKSGKVSASQEVYIEVKNSLPRLNFLEIVPQTKLITPATFNLTAKGVNDVDGTVVKYRWWYYKEGTSDERGVKTTSNPYTEMIVLGDGLPRQKNNYYFVVEMTDDNNGIINSTELLKSDVPYEVENGKNVSPLVDFTVDKSLIYVGDSINFHATASDPQGWTIPSSAYKWDFNGDGEFDDVSSGKQVSRRYNIPWEYEVRLKVDLKGLSTSKTKKIQVKRLNAFPEAAFIFDVDGKTVSFDASNSRFDETLEDKELWYSWDFDVSVDQDGNGIKDDDDQDNGITPVHVYASEGTYTVRLTVKDKLGSTDIVERIVSVGSSTLIETTSGAIATKESLRVVSDNLLSSLDLSMLDLELKKGNMVDISAKIIQANGELYNDVVYYRIIEGSGDFIPSQVNAKNGKAISTFKAESPWLIIVEVTVPMISGWPLVEHISFNVE